MEFELFLLVGFAMCCFGAYCAVQSVCRRICGLVGDESNELLALKLELSKSKQRIMELEKEIETLGGQPSQHGSTSMLAEIYITNSMAHFHTRSDCGSLKGNSWKKVQLCKFCSKKEAKKLL